MKAWTVEDKASYEGFSTLVWADTLSEAKKKALLEEHMEDAEWVDLRARRAPYADDKQNLTEDLLIILQLENGWWFHDWPIWVEGRLVGTVNFDSDDLEGIEKLGLDQYLIAKIENEHMVYQDGRWVEL